MVGSIGAQVALLTFAIAIVAGLHAGNSTITILSRAMGCMFLAMIVAQVAAWTAKLIMRDHLQKRKLKIDREHTAAQHAAEAENAPPEEQEAAIKIAEAAEA